MTFWHFFFKNNDKKLLSQDIEYIQPKEVLLINNSDELKNIYIIINKEINLYELEELCDSVGWVRRPIKKVKTALENSFVTVCLIEKNQDRNLLIGFARATSDHSFNATIWDVVIHPNFQSKGLGRALMNEIIKELRCKDISTITLFADPQVLNFYRTLGFMSDPDGVKGMFWYPL
uniref:GCN5-like N-acetyltransferase n=1 Tax=Campylaephora sungminbooi TaxID=1896769 RepID=A0A1B0RRF4_9FLOR|nr:GCN5-like N-acetyltransferase [Campylaephora sungminbooi]AKU47356.1 GCN5-like N-acetyltransferase [Campylaephora sungminbooi]ALN11803.1 GCN5-like N-acetyltransferase [Campylaephora sungminbooi]